MLTLALSNDTARERETADQLRRLVDQYDVSRWIRTRDILIEEKAIPHSHPVLTLNTRHLQQDDLLLATFLHEQLHWIVLEYQDALSHALQDIRELAPVLPTGFPEGADAEAASYLHVIINYLEWDALSELVGEARAHQVMLFWANDHYKAIYDLVLRERAAIQVIVERHNLVV